MRGLRADVEQGAASHRLAVRAGPDATRSEPDWPGRVCSPGFLRADLAKIEFLIAGGGPVQSCRMNFILALLAWVVMAVILTAGILLAIKGNLWLLGLGLAAFIVAVGKIGCATH